MSHNATNWAIKQRGIKPAAKVVLWHLCDRYHPDHGCFPSLDTLAEDCEMSRRSVQDQIEALIEAGLVSVEKMPRQRGQLPRNRYRFSFENSDDHLGQNLPRAESALGKNEHPPLANSDDHLGQNLPTNPVRVTTKGTSKENTGPSFEAFWSVWPLGRVAKQKAEKAFRKLSPQDRHLAMVRAGPWAEQWRRNNPTASPIHPATYLNAGRFNDEIQPSLIPIPGGHHDQSPQQNRQSAADDRFGRIADAAVRNRAPSRPDFGFG